MSSIKNLQNPATAEKVSGVIIIEDLNSSAKVKNFMDDQIKNWIKIILIDFNDPERILIVIIIMDTFHSNNRNVNVSLPLWLQELNFISLIRIIHNLKNLMGLLYFHQRFWNDPNQLLLKH